MFKIDEIPSSYIEDYKTLHHDIGLVQRSNGLWDLWFGQDEISDRYKDSVYLNIVDGDIISATEIHSLQVGIIIACLTSWNYLNRTGNPIYNEFGNRSYALLKNNKGKNTQYKIKQFFIECLNRMRRVYTVEHLDVLEVENNPYVYRVTFKVLSVTNTIVDGEFYIDVDSSKNISMLDISYNHPYSSVSNPLFIEATLRNEYGSILEGEVLYIYIKNQGDTKFKFYGVSESTDDNGKAYITIPPNGLNKNTEIMLVFKGNNLYNPCNSKIIDIESVEFYIKSRYTYKTILDEYNNEIRVIDKHILYLEDSKGNARDDLKFRLGELLSDYVDLDNITLQNTISIADIENNLLNEDYILEYNSNKEEDYNKLYLIPTSNTIEGTNKVYYNAYEWDNNGESLVLYSKNSYPVTVELNTTEPYEVHFLIEKDDNGLFEIDFDDGHLYYQIGLYDYEL